mmetsp:Transcript_25570/g.101948  ORF Transcript_25570/g.101948 Transcript_25570/m.101948 type:complete len:270 (-) Transcript_25570:309-1118(-)
MRYLCRNRRTKTNIDGGRASLWSPSTARMNLSPAYDLWRSSECLFEMNESPRTTQNSAGTYMPATCLMGATSSMSASARLRMVDRKSRMTPPTAKPGILKAEVAVARATSSSASMRNDANGESRIIASTMLSASAYSSAATAPMLRPQSAMVEVLPSARRYETTAAMSKRSRAPKVTYSPSERPEPEKSKATTSRPSERHTLSWGSASSRADALPWRKMSAGTMSATRSARLHREHTRASSPEMTVKSSRLNADPQNSKRTGPRWISGL